MVTPARTTTMRFQIGLASNTRSGGTGTAGAPPSSALLLISSSRLAILTYPPSGSQEIEYSVSPRGETEYSISWLPLGGYVKMASREEDISRSALEGGAPAVPVPPDRVFEAKPIWKRMVVVLAGVTMNALFAWAVFAFLAYKNGRQIDPVTTVGRVVE